MILLLILVGTIEKNFLLNLINIVLKFGDV